MATNGDLFSNLRYMVMNDSIRKIFATEEALLDFVKDGPVLILYRSKPHSISIAYNQSYEEIDLDKLDEFGAEFSRRMSGGRAVYHHHMTDLSYAIISPSAPFMKSENGMTLPDVRNAYNSLCEVPRKVLAHMGLPAKIDETNFLKVDGKKISGSAQYWSTEKGAVIQHGYILIDVPSFMTGYQMIKSKDNFEKRAKQAVSTSTALSNYRSDISAKDSDSSFNLVVEAFRQVLKCKPMALEKYQQKRIEELMRTKYDNSEWQLGKHLAVTKEKGDCIRGEQAITLGANIE